MSVALSDIAVLIEVGVAAAAVALLALPLPDVEADDPAAVERPVAASLPHLSGPAG
jgi:hypothetical protein